MHALEQIFQKYNQGSPAILLTGRSLYDLMVDPSDNKIRTVFEVLKRTCRDRFGMMVVTYSRAAGLDWDRSRIGDDRDRRAIEQVLQSHGLLQIPQDQNEPIKVIRGIYSLSRTPTKGLRWADGRPLKFAFLIEFAEHLTPGQLANGTQTDQQIVSIELAHLLAQSLALRASDNLVLFNGRDSLIDELVGGALHKVHLPQPGMDEKRVFLETASSLYNKSSFEDGLDMDSISRLIKNTPNRGLESIIRASHSTGENISAKELSRQKNRDVEEVSEHTLMALDVSRIRELELCGINLEAPKRILERCADGLLSGNRNMPLNILLVGAPGTGKTDLAILTADRAKVSAYQMLSPKGGIVGETERKARVQWRALNEWGGIAFVDEITEAMPMERSDFDGDSGASRAVTAALLTELSNETARGHRLFIATTNCPWRMGAAMRSRFTLVPVLHPLKEDFPKIIVSIARRVAPYAKLDVDDPQVKEAASVFYDKGANARHIRSQLSNAILLQGELTAKTILFAAQDMCSSSDLGSAIYADLWAIKATTSKSFLPWTDNPSQYPFPNHLQGVVDLKSGEIDQSELDARIQEYNSYANV